MRSWIVAVLVVSSVVQGCAPVQTYPGPKRPRSEVGLLESQQEARLVAIDGRRISGASFALLPGRHEIWIRLRASDRVPRTHRVGLGFCLVPLEVVAGETYATRVWSHQEDALRRSENTEFAVSIMDSLGNLRGEASECRTSEPELDG